ncbi:hypothetical protein KC19_2G265500 [Ceratodon purpureus]|uniref:Uncharacterized protein n=1 Tax=Ceratodon purpureus TaxID=3225 RepID=A0A8T0J194_CERPU|nr:hypothetical protein KC19_2G265500 [Ceratodon purpureus]
MISVWCWIFDMWRFGSVWGRGWSFLQWWECLEDLEIGLLLVEKVGREFGVMG